MAAFFSNGIRILNVHLPWLLVISLVSIQSHISAENLGSALSSSDKFTHFLVFGLLSWLIIRAVFKEKNTFLQRNYFWFVLFVLGIFSFIDEMHQYFIPGRDAEIWDWLADMAGGITFLFIYKYRNKD